MRNGWYLDPRFNKGKVTGARFGKKVGFLPLLAWDQVTMPTGVHVHECLGFWNSTRQCYKYNDYTSTLPNQLLHKYLVYSICFFFLLFFFFGSQKKIRKLNCNKRALTVLLQWSNKRFERKDERCQQNAENIDLT